MVGTRCPKDPFAYSWQYAEGSEDPEEEFAEHEFHYAMIEKKFAHEVVARVDDRIVEGWGFDEFLAPSLRPTDATQRVVREVLTLLMAVIQHGDNQCGNQRLYCGRKTAPGEGCPEDHRYLVVKDVGGTLGGYKMKTPTGDLINLSPTWSYRFWKLAPVWSWGRGAQASECTVHVLAARPPVYRATLNKQRISEAGRKFLADLLSQINDEQIAQLVQVSKLEERVSDPGPFDGLARRAVSR